MPTPNMNREQLAKAIEDCMEQGGYLVLRFGHAQMRQLREPETAVVLEALRTPPEVEEKPAGHEWMARNVNDFASHFLQRYEATGSLRESMMWAYSKTFQGVPASPASAKAAKNWPDTRDTTIEECARVCDILSGLGVQGWGRKSTTAARKCASEIRDLKFQREPQNRRSSEE